MNTEMKETGICDFKIFGSPVLDDSLVETWTELRHYLSASYRLYDNVVVDESVNEIRVGVYGGYPTRISKIISKLVKTGSDTFDTDDTVTIETAILRPLRGGYTDIIAATVTGIGYSDESNQIIFKYSSLTREPETSIFRKAS